MMEWLRWHLFSGCLEDMQGEAGYIHEGLGSWKQKDSFPYLEESRRMVEYLCLLWLCPFRFLLADDRLEPVPGPHGLDQPAGRSSCVQVLLLVSQRKGWAKKSAKRYVCKNLWTNIMTSRDSETSVDYGMVNLITHGPSLWLIMNVFDTSRE